MLAEVLRQIVQDRLTTPTEISELAGVSISTVYRWMNGQSHPGFDSVRLLIRHLSNPQAQRAILTSLLTGTAWHAQHNGASTSAGDCVASSGAPSSLDVHRAMNRVLHFLRESSRVLTLANDRLAGDPLAREPLVHAMPVLEKLLEETSEAHAVLRTACQRPSGWPPASSTTVGRSD